MNITSKGQVTIPIDIREKLGLLPNTRVEFDVRGTEVIIRKAAKPSVRGQEIVRRLQVAAKRFNKKMTTEEIMALTRGED